MHFFSRLGISRATLFSSLWFWGFAALLVWIPLPFGSNRPWASDFFGAVAGALLLAMLAAEKKAPSWSGQAPKKRLWAAAIGMTGVIVWSFIQTVPWTPLSWHHPIWLESEKILGPVASAISVDPSVLIESLVRLLGYAGCFILAFCAGRDRKRAESLLKILAWTGAAYALYGLLVYASGSETILWFDKWAYIGFLTSTFVNKNSYAAYCGLGLLCSLATAGRTLKPSFDKDRFPASRPRFFSFLESLSFTQIATLLLPVVLVAALSLTGSRAGIASALCGVLALFGALALNNGARSKKTLLVGAGLLAVFVFFVFLGGHTLVERFDAARFDEDTKIRLSGYTLALQAISDNPWLGFGLGTFDSAFRLYRDASLPLWYHHAHNDYLEMMMDLGVPAALLLFASLGLLVSCCLSGVWNRRRDAVYPAVALGASALVATHSLVDFSLHIPAIAATYAALLGLGVAQSWSSREKDSI